jgi:hypothetical protein
MLSAAQTLHPGPQFREIDNLVEDTKPGDRRVFFCTQLVSLNLRS